MMGRDEKGRYIKGHSIGTTGKQYTKEARENMRKGLKKFHKEHPDFQKGKNHVQYGKGYLFMGENNRNWKGGRIVTNDGYVYIMKPEHPNVDSGGYVAEHRLVAEAALGRYLKSSEIIHHINMNRADNRKLNLLICTVGYHFWLHRKIERLGLVDYFKGRIK